jgi:hypothetical protein
MLMVGGSVSVRADLLWDNGPFDGQHAISSELDHFLVTHGSFAADDAMFSEGGIVDGIGWMGASLIDQNHPFSSYQAQAVVLAADPDFTVVYASEPAPFDVVSTGGLYYGYRIYAGELSLPDLPLAPGTYFFGVRLTSLSGRNFQLSAGNGIVAGDSMGLFQGQDFWGGPPAPDWVTIQQFAGFTSDYSFQVYGRVPEPAAAALLGLVLLSARRR